MHPEMQERAEFVGDYIHEHHEPGKNDVGELMKEAQDAYREHREGGEGEETRENPLRGFFNASGFHPIRSADSSDYDPRRGGDVGPHHRTWREREPLRKGYHTYAAKHGVSRRTQKEALGLRSNPSGFAGEVEASAVGMVVGTLALGLALGLFFKSKAAGCGCAPSAAASGPAAYPPTPTPDAASMPI